MTGEARTRWGDDRLDDYVRDTRRWLEALERRINGLPDRLRAVEVGLEAVGEDVSEVKHGVNRLVELREDDTRWTRQQRDSLDLDARKETKADKRVSQSAIYGIIIAFVSAVLTLAAAGVFR